MSRRYLVVDVFSEEVTRGNPVAVVLDCAGLDTPSMQHIARWTNLSETTFVLPPTNPAADYRLRIFTPSQELPFAGHPTLGSAHAVASRGIAAPRSGQLLQECGAGLITVKIAPAAGVANYTFGLPRAKLTPVSNEAVADLQVALGASIDPAVAPALVDVGPTWLIASMNSAEKLLALEPDLQRLAALERSLRATGTTLFAPTGASGRDIEVRSFVPCDGISEDPVCGSGNGSVAAFRRERAQLPAGPVEYVAYQGRRVGRDGRVQVTLDVSGAIWIGGACITTVEGFLQV